MSTGLLHLARMLSGESIENVEFDVRAIDGSWDDEEYVLTYEVEIMTVRGEIIIAGRTAYGGGGRARPKFSMRIEDLGGVAGSIAKSPAKVQYSWTSSGSA
ncbi:MAG: hypothetical protein JWN01_28 [Patescibacteria group bacterium]|nr:hypothetical protein [Patescibacteria group bacterium]